jgi:limonene-1,2-epoxide hydrolase
MNAALEQKVRQYLGHFHQDPIDFDALAAMLAEDASYQANVPVVEVLQGRQAIRDELERQLKLYGKCDFQIINCASNDHQVFVERKDYVTDFETGVRVLTPVNAIFEFNDDGLICGWREYWDLGSVQQQLGISPEHMSQMMGK